MRTMLVIGALMISSTAAAQTAAPAPGPCWPSNHIDKVVVHLADGSSTRGSLLCFGIEDLTVVDKDAVHRFRLEDVREVRKAADPIWDGALKGASIGLLVLVFGCPAECVARTAGAYALLGTLLDAIDTNADSIYRPARTKHASLRFRVRF
jgi:hypothetical protein